jgi:hypothetical protein
MGEPGRFQALLERWRELPTSWRVNAGLYLLAGLSLVALLAQVVTGGGSRPRRVEVASRPSARPTTSAVLAPSTTALAPTTVAGPTTTVPPATAAAAAPKAAAGSATTRPRATASPGSPSPAPPGNTPAPGPSPAPACHNSTDPACGAFFWDPPAGSNAPVGVSVQASPFTPHANDEVTFNITVTDPDHAISDNCTVARFGDGTSQDFPCNPAPCANAHGPWVPPAQETGSRVFRFTHRYATPGDFQAEFSFRTDSDRCPDPYGSGPTTALIPIKVSP